MNLKPGEYMITNLNRPCVECRIVDVESGLLHHKRNVPLHLPQPMSKMNKVVKETGENTLLRHVSTGTKTGKSCNNAREIDRISGVFAPMMRVDSIDKFGLDTRMLAKDGVQKYSS